MALTELKFVLRNLMRKSIHLLTATACPYL